jgi:hypothetical protein
VSKQCQVKHFILFSAATFCSLYQSSVVLASKEQWKPATYLPTAFVVVRSLCQRRSTTTNKHTAKFHDRCRLVNEGLDVRGWKECLITALHSHSLKTAQYRHPSLFSGSYFRFRIFTGLPQKQIYKKKIVKFSEHSIAVFPQIFSLAKPFWFRKKRILTSLFT